MFVFKTPFCASFFQVNSLPVRKTPSHLRPPSSPLSGKPHNPHTLPMYLQERRLPSSLYLSTEVCLISFQTGRSTLPEVMSWEWHLLPAHTSLHVCVCVCVVWSRKSSWQIYTHKIYHHGDIWICQNILCSNGTTVAKLGQGNWKSWKVIKYGIFGH